MKTFSMLLSGICIIVSTILILYVYYGLIVNGVEDRIRRLLGNREEKEINMTVGKMNKINDWMTHLDQQTMDLSDQLAVTQVTMEYLAKLEPIYDKYTGSGKEKRYR